MIVGVVTLAAGLFGMAAVGYALTPVPAQSQSKDSVDDTGSVITYADGSTLARLGVKRKLVTYAQIPRPVQDAVIAAENDSFREDPGISFSGMARSLLNTVTGRQVQGGSTITQQMARNYYDGLSQERSVSRKFKEIFVAVKVSKSLSKETILEQYLNTIYFGRGAYGIGAAAEAFFNVKDVAKLTPEQGAYLAGRIQNPVRFDRAEADGNSAATEERYAYVIREMSTLDPAAYGTLPTRSPSSPKRVKERNTDYYKGLRGYMINAVLDELKARTGLTLDDVEKGGYRIRSTFDKRLMKAAKDAVHRHTRALSSEFTTTVASVDPRNGRVNAFYSGDDYTTDQWNDAFVSQKQAASAFKTYVLAAWLEQGYSLDSLLPASSPIKLAGTSPIKNDHPSRATAVDVLDATANSVNTAYAKMGEKVGLDSVIDIAARAGLNKSNLESARDRHRYLITIGSNQVTAVEQAGGYSIFAQGGTHHDNHVIINVTKNGRNHYTEKSTPTQVISPEAAADATSALREVVTRGTGRNAALPGRPVAGKTGTNNENKEAWFVGFTPQVSTAVGMFRQECRTKTGKVIPPRHKTCPWFRGKDPAKETRYTKDNPYTRPYEVPLGTTFEGATYPAAIWRTFMTEATKGQPVEQFPPRAGIGITEHLAPKPTPTTTPAADPCTGPTCQATTPPPPDTTTSPEEYDSTRTPEDDPAPQEDSADSAPIPEDDTDPVPQNNTNPAPPENQDASTGNAADSAP
ncbi:transglycosylase domain-containing protein [Nonomuraea sp. NPDC050790]|uniref:transglycosylase domain-containing protein n=1 Tax=Nonomuraea sp. NPDC050790 TaxID=3364371 RepID=UPI00379E753F